MKAVSEANIGASASRILRKFHAWRSRQVPKTPYKRLGMVRANDSSVMEPSASLNLTVIGSALPLLLILATLVLGGLGVVQTASAADVLISSQAAPQQGPLSQRL